jgi:hypothetical protein
MRAVFRSILPAIAFLAVVAVVAGLANRMTAQPQTPQSWTPPPGFEQIAAIDAADGTHVVLWIGRSGPPKPSDCWYLAAEQIGSVGGCGGTLGQPWVNKYAGVVAGGTGEQAARWLRLNDGAPIAVSRGHFIANVVPTSKTVSMELLDDNQKRLAQFTDVPVGGDV